MGETLCSSVSPTTVTHGLPDLFQKGLSYEIVARENPYSIVVFPNPFRTQGGGKSCRKTADYVNHCQENTFSPPPPECKRGVGEKLCSRFSPTRVSSRILVSGDPWIKLRDGRAGKPLRHSGFPEPFPHSLVLGAGEKNGNFSTHTMSFPSA